MAIELNRQTGAPVSPPGGFRGPGGTGGPGGYGGRAAPRAGSHSPPCEKSVPPGEQSTPVTLDNHVTLDYDHAGEVIPHHYAFAVGGAEFEAAFGRIRDAGISYHADPACRQAGQVYTSKNGNRGACFRDPDRHLMEILTVAAGASS